MPLKIIYKMFKNVRTILTLCICSFQYRKLVHERKFYNPVEIMQYNLGVKLILNEINGFEKNTFENDISQNKSQT